MLTAWQDVSRTRSELSFFADGGRGQHSMLRILFLYAKLHPDVGYMQGMNEVLAPILFVYGTDAAQEWAAEAEADAFHSFTSIAGAMRLLYAPSRSDPSRSGADTQMDRLMMLLRQHDPVLWQHLVGFSWCLIRCSWTHSAHSLLLLRTRSD